MTFPAGLTTITVTGQNLIDFGGFRLNGIVVFTASSPVSDPAAAAVVAGSAQGVVTDGTMAPVVLPATDSVSPAFAYTITFRLQDADGNGPPPYAGVSIPHTLGESVDLSALVPGSAPLPPTAFGTANTWEATQTLDGSPPLSVPGGSDGDVLTVDSEGNVTLQPVPGVSGTVVSVFGRSGTVTAQAGDYTAAQVGADASGAASAAEAYADTAKLAKSANLADVAARQAALNNLTGSQAAGRYLRSDGTNAALAAIQAGDVPTLNQSTTGNAATATNLAGAATFPAEVTPKVVTLAQSGGAVAVNGALGNVFRLVLTASGWTLSNPTGMTDGQAVRVRLVQDGTGGRTLSYGSAWDFGSAGAPVLSTGAGKVDYIVGEWSADANAGAGAVVVSAALGY